MQKDSEQSESAGAVSSSALLFDAVWPGEEEVEKLWHAQGGIDFDGMGWMTPRLIRISDRILERRELRIEKKRILGVLGLKA